MGKLEMEITLHTKLEEEILYPAYKKAGGKEQEKMYYEAKEEHRTVDSLVQSTSSTCTAPSCRPSP